MINCHCPTSTSFQISPSFLDRGEVSTVEHINRFIVQCGEAAQHDALKVRLFSMSLSGSVFTWFTTLPANSIIYWADLEKQFHQFLYSGVEEMKLTDLTNLRQRNDELVATFIQRFRDVKNRCFSLVLSDQHLLKLPSKDSCHISRRSMLPRSSTTSVRWLTG